MEAFRQNPFRAIVSWSAVQDWFANLLAHGLFQRFPNLRMASIETGSDWVFHLFDKLKKSYSQTPGRLPRGPARDVQAATCGCRRTTRTTSRGLRDLVGADHMLMGSDYPHAEGLAEPSTYIKDLENFGFTPEDSKLVMRDNGWSSPSVALRDDARLAVGGHLPNPSSPRSPVPAGRSSCARKPCSARPCSCSPTGRSRSSSCCTARPSDWATGPT